MSKTLICEATTGTLTEVTEKGIVPIVVASPGWGSSGWYGTKVLENAVGAKVFPAGTHLYMDHPTESEDMERPERSVRDLVAVLESDAAWDPKQGIVGEAKVFKPYRDLFRDEDFVNAIGLSLRAYADTTVGEAEGRKGTIITELLESQSIDFVTKAGRGGKVLAVLESARAQVREATANDVRDSLQTAVMDANPGDKVYAWVRDFDPDAGLVYFTVDGPDGSDTFQQAYTLADDGTANLAGERVGVTVRTEYVPVNPTSDPATESGTTNVPAPAGQPNPTPNVQEDTMGTIQVDEAEHGRLTEAAGRVTALETERDTDRAALSEAHRVIDTSAARETVREAASDATVTLNDFEVAGIAADYPKGEDGRLDKDKLAEAAKTAVAKIAESRGVGSVRGFNSDTTDTTAVTVQESTATVLGAFGIPTSQEG